jgi:biopolymer transport protein ExbD
VKFQPRRPEEPDLNMTSLIDVVLLLLIFFMLSTKFIDEGRLKIRLPEAGIAPEAEAQRESIEIAVSAGGNRAMAVTIRADARAMHQSVVTAMDVAGRLGYRQINIATVNDETEGS